MAPWQFNDVHAAPRRRGERRARSVVIVSWECDEDEARGYEGGEQGEQRVKSERGETSWHESFGG